MLVNGLIEEPVDEAGVVDCCRGVGVGFSLRESLNSDLTGAAGGGGGGGGGGNEDTVEVEGTEGLLAWTFENGLIDEPNDAVAVDCCGGGGCETGVAG